jgi:hypothetical protein
MHGVWGVATIRRFLLHVLPKGFMRIRNFGFLANRRRATLLALCFQLLGSEPILELGFRTGDSITQVRQQFPCKEVFQKLLYSSLPPTTVHTTYTSFTLSGSIVNMSPERSTKSAYLPGTREPRFPSTKLAHAPLIV